MEGSFLVLGGLYKDSRGRRCWLAARNPGRDAMFFIEGQRFIYHHELEKNVKRRYTRYNPPQMPNAPDWWINHHTGRSRTPAHVAANKQNGGWNGWYAADIKERFYILSGPTIERLFYDEEGPLRKTDRLICQPLLV